MTSRRIQLTTNDILEKEFKKQVRGYNEAEVDAFLDIIIRDYEAFNQEIQQLKQENERYRNSTDIHRSKMPVNNQQVNYDVLKRLSNLEKAVFGQKRNEIEG